MGGGEVHDMISATLPSTFLRNMLQSCSVAKLLDITMVHNRVYIGIPSKAMNEKNIFLYKKLIH